MLSLICSDFRDPLVLKSLYLNVRNHIEYESVVYKSSWFINHQTNIDRLEFVKIFYSTYFGNSVILSLYLFRAVLFQTLKLRNNYENFPKVWVILMF